jgi:aspartyl-tRNA(Asn)/glutamyl-tRNA(Gln) amidotransferase subunit A
VSSPRLHGWTAAELLRAHRTRRLSPVEATRAILERIERINPRLNPFCRIDADGALKSARESEARWLRGQPRGLLDGVPVSVKDVLLVAGMPTGFGSRTVNLDPPWDVDSPAASRLREHGAVILGKTATPEFGHRFTTDSPLTGITRNPWNPERSPGGSSGGAGAAAAAGLGPLHVGTDGGGSIRIPAAWCGVVGFKPTYGRVPGWPPSRWGTLSHIGPLARSVEDAALLLTVLADPDPRDGQALPPDPRDYRVGLEEGVRGLRIAFSPDLGLTGVPAVIAESIVAAARRFEELGAVVEEAPPPGIAEAPALYDRMKGAVFAEQLDAMTPEQRQLTDPILREMAESGARLSAIDYQRVLVGRQEIIDRMHRFFTDYDLLLSPVSHLSPLPVPGHPRESRTPFFTSWVNLTMQPAASVPCGFGNDGMPVGLQIIGSRHADARVLRAARAFESARGPIRYPEL